MIAALLLLVLGAVLLIPWAFGAPGGGSRWRMAGFGMVLLAVGLGWLLVVAAVGPS